MKTVSLAVLLLTIVPVAGTAQTKPEDQITYRQSGMMFMRWNMSTIKAQVVDNPQTYNKDQVLANAKAIEAIANTNLGSLFGRGTETGEGWRATRVKSEFFAQPDEVKKLATAFVKEAGNLATVAQSGDAAAIKTQFVKLNDTCKTCHDNFRSKN